MLSDAQITAGSTRLVSNKLTQKDIDSLVSNFRLLVGSLESKYEYAFNADLLALDDADGRARAAKMAGVLLLLIKDGFKVTNLTGKVEISKDDQRKLTILYAFNMLYQTPIELTEVQVLLNSTILNFSQSVPNSRVW